MLRVCPLALTGCAFKADFPKCCCVRHNVICWLSRLGFILLSDYLSMQMTDERMMPSFSLDNTVTRQINT